jgi:hypothetical protein
MYYYWNGNHVDFEIVKSKTTNGGELYFEKSRANEINFNNKIVINFCGNDSKSQSRAEFYNRSINTWLNNTSHKKNVTTFSVYYPQVQPLFNVSPMVSLNYNKFAQELFHNVMFESERMCSVEDMKRKLGNVVFSGHSAGGHVMNELMKSFARILRAHGLSKRDILEVFDSIVFVGYAPYKLIDAPIKSIIVAPLYDSMGSVRQVYRTMAAKEDVLSSIPPEYMFGTRITARGQYNFVRDYKYRMSGDPFVCYLSKNALMMTPDLLYNDGRCEDHNFIGAIAYDRDNPYQTEAGRLTAKFLINTFDYCFSTDRKEFDLYELYKQTLAAGKENCLYT